MVQPGCTVLLRYCLRPPRQENPLAHQLGHKVLKTYSPSILSDGLSHFRPSEKQTNRKIS
ncbi:hypothetical protein [Neisseria subflava]|uniref:hypothetical protein n=1 Tax=Neisseria subflava TaxID=28449 RepID=UPI0035570494